MAEKRMLGALRAGACMLAALTGSACATDRYAGIDLRPGSASVVVQELARRAQAGDKRAQLELGVRYEEGRGLSLDRERAASLYRRAATPSGGTLWVYNPPVGSSAGRIIPVDRGPNRAGLAEAGARLRRLIAGLGQQDNVGAVIGDEKP